MVTARWAVLAALVLHATACGSSEEALERPAPGGGVTLAFVGDTMLGRSFNALLADDPQYEVARGFEAQANAAEIFCFNLETTLTESDDPWAGKEYNFKLKTF